MIDPTRALESLMEVSQSDMISPTDRGILKAAEQVLRVLAQDYEKEKQSESALLAQIYG